MQEQAVHWIHAGQTAAELSGISPERLALPELPPHLLDQLGRALHDLRISVTDRCNFRCTYCMPKEVFDKDFPYLPSASMLSFDEIERIARVSAALGVRKLRLTGGAPSHARASHPRRGRRRARSPCALPRSSAESPATRCCRHGPWSRSG